MHTAAKFLTVSLGALVVALALVRPAAADAEVAEIYARTQTRQQADRIVTAITQGRVPGWMLASVEYDAATRTFIVYAVRTNASAESAHASQAWQMAFDNPKGAQASFTIDGQGDHRSSWIGKA